MRKNSAFVLVLVLFCLKFISCTPSVNSSSIVLPQVEEPEQPETAEPTEMPEQPETAKPTEQKKIRVLRFHMMMIVHLVERSCLLQSHLQIMILIQQSLMFLLKIQALHIHLM